ncbi:MAG TPA: peptide chain release factor aRF-1, partial [Nitrososphaerales archaeon]|nr:peptide chain release factor aRF-1 [Nitrososphaerales archaeon]
FDSVQLYRIRKLLQELSSKSGRGTELVTLYLPPKKPIHEAISALREESGTASNIKSDTTRAHVQDALTKTMQRLRLYKTTPENGLIIFCGAIPGPGGPGNEIIELHEVLPSKPVPNYLYRCLAPESLVLLLDGSQLPIADIGNETSLEVVTADLEHGKIGSALAESHIQTRLGDRKAYRIEVESGRSLVATDDHPIFTPRGWMTIGVLKAGDLTCIKPVLDQVENTDFSNDILVDESKIRQIEYPPANIELTISRLKERGLLPLRSSNPKLHLLSRFLGHLFSDGSLTHNLELRRGKKYSHYTVDICASEDSDYIAIKSDLGKLGVQLQKSFRSTHVISKDGRSYSTSTLHAKMRDTVLCTLLRALGAPVGSKVRNCPGLPEWIKKASASVQREFLSAYMGGDGEAPRMQKLGSISPIKLTFHRIVERQEEGVHFAHDIERLFRNFGVEANKISRVPGYIRKDGSRTVEIEIRFKLSQENVLKICQSIGYRYSKGKSLQAEYVGEYLRIKSRLVDALHDRLKLAQEMKAYGNSAKEISEVLQIKTSTARQWSTGKITNPIVRVSSFPEFEDWQHLATQNLEDGLVWESITSIEEVSIDRVYDLTLGGKSHSFFANGFLVHNCDDHFHLDPLREMLKEENVVGILALDATEAGLGIVSGDSWEVIDTTSSGVSGKTRKGGQSARRYERLREMELTEYYNRLADHAKKAFLEQYTIKGLIVSGPGPTKDQFVKENYLDYRLQKAIIGVLDTGYSGREGVRETIEKSGELLQNVRVVEESKLVQRFLREINSDSGLAIYGIEDVIKALRRAAVDVVMISDDSDVLYLRATCSRCGEIRERFIKRSQYVSEKQTLLSTPCPKCGSTEIELSEKDIVDYFADIALDSGARVEVISSKTEDGAMLKNFGTVSAILRYRV